VRAAGGCWWLSWAAACGAADSAGSLPWGLASCAQSAPVPAGATDVGCSDAHLTRTAHAMDRALGQMRATGVSPTTASHRPSCSARPRPAVTSRWSNRRWRWFGPSCRPSVPCCRRGWRARARARRTVRTGRCVRVRGEITGSPKCRNLGEISVSSDSEQPHYLPPHPYAVSEPARDAWG
jgi:hypothetical protein